MKNLNNAAFTLSAHDERLPFLVGREVYFAMVGHRFISNGHYPFGLIVSTKEPDDRPHCDTRHLNDHPHFRPLRDGADSTYSVIVPPILKGEITDIKYVTDGKQTSICHVHVYSEATGCLILAAGDILADTPQAVQAALNALTQQSADALLQYKQETNRQSQAATRQLDVLAAQRLYRSAKAAVDRATGGARPYTLPIPTKLVIVDADGKKPNESIKAVLKLGRFVNYTLDLRRSYLRLKNAEKLYFTWPHTLSNQTYSLPTPVQSSVINDLVTILFATVDKKPVVSPLFSGPHDFVTAANTSHPSLPFSLTRVANNHDGSAVHIRTPFIGRYVAGIKVQSCDESPDRLLAMDFSAFGVSQYGQSPHAIRVAQRGSTRFEDTFYISKKALFLTVVQALNDVWESEEASNFYFLPDYSQKLLKSALIAINKVQPYRAWLREARAVAKTIKAS